MGTPRVIRMNAAATSNAIGTGRNAPPSRARFFTYCVNVPVTGTSHPAESTWHGASTDFVWPTSHGTRAIRTRGAATRKTATPGGNNANTMVSTTTFSMGDEIMVASTVVELAPP